MGLKLTRIIVKEEIKLLRSETAALQKRVDELETDGKVWQEETGVMDGIDGGSSSEDTA